MITLLKNFLFLTALLTAGAIFARWTFNRQGRLDAPVRFAAVPIVVVIFGFLSPNIYIFCLACALIPFAVARTKVEVAALTILLLLTVPDIGFYVQAGGSLLLQTQSTSMVALGCVAAALTKPGPINRGWQKSDLVFVPLMLTLIWMHSRGLSPATYLRETIDALMLLAIPTWMMTRCVRTEEDLRRVMTAFVLGIIMVSVVAMYEGIRTWPLYQSFVHDLSPRAETASLTRRVRGGFMRAPGPFAESTRFGYVLFIGLLATLVSPVFRRNGGRVWAVAAVCLALFFTQSRGAWLGAGVGSVVLLWYRGRASLATAIVAIGAAGYGMLALIAGNSGALAEMIGRAGDSVGTADYRKELWTRSLEEFAKRPGLGLDIAGVQVAMNDLRQGEKIIDFVNTYAWFGVIGGSLGLAIFVLTAAMALWRARPRKGFARRRNAPTDWNAFVFAATIGCMATLAGTGFISSTRLWFFVLLAVGAAAARVRKSAPVPPRRAPMPAGPLISFPQVPAAQR